MEGGSGGKRRGMMEGSGVEGCCGARGGRDGGGGVQLQEARERSKNRRDLPRKRGELLGKGPTESESEREGEKEDRGVRKERE